MHEGQQRCVVITGADGGIGQALLREFHQAGWRCVVHTLSPVMTSAEACVVGDLAEAQTAADLITSALQTCGRIDALINNAAWDPGAVALDEHAPAFVTRLLTVNLAAPLELIRLAHPDLARRRGAVVNVSSIQAQCSLAGHAAYAAAKGGLEAATRQLAVELGPEGIRVNAVAPGFVRVPRTLAGKDPVTLAARAQRVPLGRLAEPAEIATVVRFLCEAGSAQVTGCVIPIDGGTRCVLPSHIPEPGDALCPH